MINNKQTNKLEQTHTEGIKQGLEGTEAERPEQDVWIAPEFNHDVQTHFNVRCDFLLYVTSLSIYLSPSLPLSLSPFLFLSLSLSFFITLSVFLFLFQRMGRWNVVCMCVCVLHKIFLPLVVSYMNE